MEDIKNRNRNAHGFLGKVQKDLRELWLEIPGDCHLNCSYCLAYENKADFRFVSGKRIDVRSDLLTPEEYLNVLQSFVNDFPLSDEEKVRGIKKQVAIPAAGEPFFSDRMRSYLFAIVDFCEEHDIILSIFTTGDLITEEDAIRLSPKKNIRLLIKFNSFNAEIQDKLVRHKGYAFGRTAVLLNLIALGFNDGRLGIVSSLMPNNLEEIEAMLCFARTMNLIFDVDTIVSRGRGKKSECLMMNRQTMPEAIYKLQKLDESFGTYWQANATYIGSNSCTRFSYHLYIQNNGNVSPCLGSTQIVYGNIRQESLTKLWQSKLSQIVRQHEVVGVCATCANFGKNCFSCLGRSTNNLTAEDIIANCGIPTCGCNLIGPV